MTDKQFPPAQALRAVPLEEVAELGWRVGFFTVYLPPEQIVRVVERDSQRAAR